LAHGFSKIFQISIRIDLRDFWLFDPIFILIGLRDIKAHGMKQPGNAELSSTETTKQRRLDLGFQKFSKSIMTL